MPQMDWKSSLEALRGFMPEMQEEPHAENAPASQQADSGSFGEKARLDIILDKKGRKGKSATIVAGFTVDDDTVSEIARRLKQRLGVGGSSRGGEILIQGDKRKETAAALTDLGLKCRII